MDQRRHRVQRVEQEVRLQLLRQLGELRLLRQARLLLGAQPLDRPGAVRTQAELDAAQQRVVEDELERLVGQHLEAPAGLERARRRANRGRSAAGTSRRRRPTSCSGIHAHMCRNQRAGWPSRWSKRGERADLHDGQRRGDERGGAVVDERPPELPAARPQVLLRAEHEQEQPEGEPDPQQPPPQPPGSAVDKRTIDVLRKWTLADHRAILTGPLERSRPAARRRRALCQSRARRDVVASQPGSARLPSWREPSCSTGSPTRTPGSHWRR